MRPLIAEARCCTNWRAVPADRRLCFLPCIFSSIT